MIFSVFVCVYIYMRWGRRSCIVFGMLASDKYSISYLEGFVHWKTEVLILALMQTWANAWPWANDLRSVVVSHSEKIS